MPSFGGINIFGTSVVMNTNDNPRARQVNAFFGISGLELLDGGSRGRFTDVSGVLAGASAAALSAAESLFRSYDDGVARTLIDNFGMASSNVCLQSFHPSGRVKQSPSGYFFRPYQARFLHLM
jgi:hypothetical protein